MFPAPGYCDEEMMFFRATGLHAPAVDSPHRADEDEDITVHPTTVAEARAMLARGDIVDLKTAFALTLI
jgi:ADP-ribose pyrophosphatase